ncbi:6-pyruvoyl-tetrahydropterin synthase domain protein [Burkholderia thailandensis]|uniref:6-pyruvoyl-tetrahydropterin synthase domain protein n=1 Tax=Burkholderia thailandensis TaxID=57975 RepID=A0AAW9CQT5_BURTH|nr:6-pyruvoyl-tetrahydropterin synthase domain protein [Burkholderia thailandensis]MDW9251162.1 6-pyruvoyl-tetrahydropterin synthase domain protein [Burkholderia thailandensis]
METSALDFAGVPADARTAAKKRRLIAAAAVGNAFEFYDFTVYSFFAILIGKLFFPVHSPFGYPHIRRTESACPSSLRSGASARACCSMRGVSRCSASCPASGRAACRAVSKCSTVSIVTGITATFTCANTSSVMPTPCCR